MTFIDRIKKISFPHSYALLFLLIIVCALLTWVVPSGQYDTTTVTVDGSERTVVVPGTYHQIAKIADDGTDYRQGIQAVLEAPGNGIIAPWR